MLRIVAVHAAARPPSVMLMNPGSVFILLPCQSVRRRRPLDLRARAVASEGRVAAFDESWPHLGTVGADGSRPSDHRSFLPKRLEQTPFPRPAVVHHHAGFHASDPMTASRARKDVDSRYTRAANDAG